MTACRDQEPLLLDRAAGLIAPDDAARLEAHLAGCAPCRAEAAALATTLELVMLPPPDAAEQRALAGLADSLRQARDASARRRAWPLRVGAGLAVAAAAAAFLVAPAFSRRAPQLTAEEAAAALAAAAPAVTWEPPDPDELWEVAGAVEDDDATATTATTTSDPGTSAAIAAADAWFDGDTSTR
jgi:anti-sigma factor RsiW